MPWKYYTDDGMVGIVVDPMFRENLVLLAASRPVWIVETPGN